MRYFFLGCCFAISFQASAQQQLGLRLENYAGVSSLPLNPTGNLHNPLKWDLNLIGAGVFFENNYFFIKQASTFDLLKNGPGSDFLLAKDLEGQVPPGTYLVDFFDNGRPRFFNLDGHLDGPSLAVKIGEMHSAGVFTRLRWHGSTHDIPNEFSYYKYDGRAFFDPFEVKPFTGAFMSWTEIGLNYAIKFPTYQGHLGFGASLKRLQGYEAGFLENLEPWEHTKINRSTIDVAGPNGRFGYTSSNLKDQGFGPVKNGTGFGLDLGATLTIEESEDSYRWRFSVAVLDLGGIRFTENAQAHQVDTEAHIEIVSEDYEQFQSAEQVDDAIRLFSQQALGDSLASFLGNSFKMSLPTSLSLQADYAFSESVFVNATLLQRVRLGAAGPQRGNLFALTPRFESRWFSASLPLALYDWQAPRIGFAARLGYLTVGSDDLGSLVGSGDYTGTDLYFALKINPFELGWNLSGNGGGKRRYGGRGKVKCYDF